MGPRRALILNALANFVGPFLFSVAVAKSIGHEIVVEAAATQPVVLAALIGAIGWNVLTWLLGLPSSSSHALLGGLIGAAMTGHSSGAILRPGLVKVLLALLVSSSSVCWPAAAWRRILRCLRRAGRVAQR